MTKATCPLCKSALSDDVIMKERGQPDLDDQGIPLACSAQHGFGLPVIQPGYWAVALDGVPVDRCVAYDRRSGEVWRYTGEIVGDELRIERLEGAVTVRPLPPRAPAERIMPEWRPGRRDVRS